MAQGLRWREQDDDVDNDGEDHDDDDADMFLKINFTKQNINKVFWTATRCRVLASDGIFRQISRGSLNGHTQGTG